MNTSAAIHPALCATGDVEPLPINWMNSASGATNPIIMRVPGDMKYYRLNKL